MRKLYETKETLSEELEVMEVFADKFNLEFRKMPIQYRLDFALMRKGQSNIFGMAEIRCRSGTWYPTLLVSLQKLMHMDEYSKFGIRCVLVLKIEGNVYYWPYGNFSEYDIGWGGRNIPRDDQDSEPVVHIPRSAFKAI